MSKVITNPSPKDRFQQADQHITQHRDLIQSPQFERAIHYALLQYQSNLSRTQMDNFNAAAACHLKITGAQEFIQVLRNLSESATIPTRTPLTDNLDHSAQS